MIKLFLTQQQRGVSHWPAYSQTIGLHELLFLQLFSQQLPLQPHLKAHPALQHPVSEPGAWPQWGELSPEPWLPTGSIRTHLKMEVTVICGNNKKRLLHPCLKYYIYMRSVSCLSTKKVVSAVQRLTWIYSHFIFIVLLCLLSIHWRLWWFGSVWEGIHTDTCCFIIPIS